MSEYETPPGRTMPDDPEQASGQLEMDEEDLRAGLSGLAGMAAGSLGVEDLLAQIAGFASLAIPGVDGAGVTLLRTDSDTARIEGWGTTTAFVGEIDRLQYEVIEEGPCLSCMVTRTPVVSGALGSDRRWPRFGGRVARLGVNSALSLPLVVGDAVIGAINCYARASDAFSDHSVQLGARFAGPAAVAVHNAQLLSAARTKADQLQAALTSRAVIDQAIGIVRSRAGGSSDEAFARLKQISQAANVKLSVVAQRLVDEAVRRAQARHTDSWTPDPTRRSRDGRALNHCQYGRNSGWSR